MTTTTTTRLTTQLNGLVADATVIYGKLRYFHWTVRGPRFFELHAKFESLYDAFADHVDALAERIVMLGEKPVGTLRQALDRATVRETPESPTDREMVTALAADLELFLRSTREAIERAEEERDRTTVNLLDDLADGLEKELWMLRSWLG